MSLSEIDLNRLLEPDSLVPADLEIRVVEGGDINEWVEENVHMAHKTFMASVSDVLATQFYGRIPHNKNYVYFENTTMVAVGKFLEFVYSKPTEFTLSSLSIDNLFLLLSLADKFAILPLGDKVKIAIEEFSLEKSNVMEVAGVAGNYSEVFNEVCQELEKRCARYLTKCMNDYANVSTFLLNNVDDLDLLKKLMRSEQERPKEFELPDEYDYLRCEHGLKKEPLIANEYPCYYCDLCSQDIPYGMETFSCRICDHDVCLNCSSQK